MKTGRSHGAARTGHIKPLFKEYQKNLRLYNAVDFDDLSCCRWSCWKDDQKVREEYHERFRYLLVDEFQDTSAAQYDLMRLLVGPEENVCVVGDDDQSIYSWRGASYENILRVREGLPAVREIKLEQNYRSTKTILKAANALISRNTNRKPKALWTGLPEGEPIEVYQRRNEIEEAEYIVSRIRTLMIRESLRFQDFGVLLRANHLTRALEEVFRKENIPYVVSGGMSFFERQEVRDMLAYLKLIANHDDDTSLLRIINTPRRGIGRKLLERAAAHAAEHHCSLFSALAGPRVAQPAASARRGEVRARPRPSSSIHRLRFPRPVPAGPEEARAVAAGAGGGDRLLGPPAFREQGCEGQGRGEVEVRQRGVPDGLHCRFRGGSRRRATRVSSTTLRASSLASRDDLDAREEGGRVNLMTIHSAKGLEFPVVFVAGVEKDIIPHARSMERSKTRTSRRSGGCSTWRLTRAQKHLFLSFCARRRRMGKPVDAYPSPFLDELPAECMSAPVEDKDFVPDFGGAWKKIAGG